MGKQFLTFLFKTGLMAGVKLAQDYPEMIQQISLEDMRDTFEDVASEAVDEALEEFDIQIEGE